MLGNCLNHQGFYGFGEIQYRRMLDKLSDFYDVTDNGVKLNRKGHEALIGEHNYASEIYNEIDFGGISRLDYQFSASENKLIKTITNVN